MSPPRFRSRLRRNRPRMGSPLGNWWLVWRMPVLLLIVMAVWWFGLRPLSDDAEWQTVNDRFALCGARGSSQPGCVVDGDTLILGFSKAQRRIRLTGFDAPELNGACPAESRRAIEARDALHQWLGQGAFEWDGGDAPPRDQYGRELRAVRRTMADGSREYLADTMINRGLAGGSGWGSTEPDWCE
ncbi:thermonuclease family protein [Erythrobacter aurantius]|uniref:thermonuclease family protein n=1 Tax=Erythrobacter aurantius TaxID=2909249 RepID=UPI00207AD641|nr:hypothetical protein [Erythrobacter aurantius]